MGNIGSAGRVSSASTVNQKIREILKAEYISITTENDMKMANIFTGPNFYETEIIF